VSIDSRLVVFGIQELTEDLWSFAMYLIARFGWQLVRRRPNRQRLFVVDEAWLLLRHREGARFLEGIARPARSYALGLVFITQDVKHVLGDSRDSVVVDDLFATLLHWQSSKGQQYGAQTQHLVAQHFDLSPAEQRGCP
jgi:conjugal transfer ATP-binding protein TraC